MSLSLSLSLSLSGLRTPLSRDGENYRKRELEAIQLANEIESKNMVGGVCVRVCVCDYVCTCVC